MDIALMNQYKQGLDKLNSWCIKNIDVEGHLTERTDDLVAYHLLPYLTDNLGLKEETYRVIHFLLHSFATHDGGLRQQLTDPVSLPMSEQLPEMMSWIGIAAHRMGRFETSFAFARYLRSYYDPEQGAFTALAPYEQIESVLDLSSSTMLGLLSLQMGDLKKAKRAGNFLQRCIALQTTKDQVFYMRLEKDGQLISRFPKGQDKFYMITTASADTNLYCLAMPVIFLGKLYLATQDESYLRAAQNYFETASHFEQKTESTLGWAAAVLANITKESRYINSARRTAEKILSSQNDNGSWDHTNIVQKYYNTAINGITLSELIMELSIT